MINPPYLIFLGDAQDDLAAKVAIGIRHWRPELCIGQHSFENCRVDCKLPEMSIEEAREAGAKTLVVGIANRGGVISEKWNECLKLALKSGLDLAAGLHNKLDEIASLSSVAKEYGRNLFDFRHSKINIPVGSGKKRRGKRVLSVGTDCSCGKMYTMLALEKELLNQNLNAKFVATGQTGILISGQNDGISLDCVVGDFISGAAEILAPECSLENYWYCIEGQGSVLHPSYAGVTVGLLHGSQPDAIVLCHEPTRNKMRGVDYPIPDIGECMELSLTLARLTNPNVKCVGISIDTSKLDFTQASNYMQSIENTFNLPVVDPVRDGMKRIAQRLLQIYN